MTERLVAELTRTGGFAGRQLRARVDTDNLPVGEAQRLAAMIDNVDLDGLAAAPAPPSEARDTMRYDLTVQRGGRRWAATLAEPQVPAELRPLIQYLSTAAGSTPA